MAKREPKGTLALAMSGKNASQLDTIANEVNIISPQIIDNDNIEYKTILLGGTYRESTPDNTESNSDYLTLPTVEVELLEPLILATNIPYDSSVKAYYYTLIGGELVREGNANIVDGEFYRTITIPNTGGGSVDISAYRITINGVTTFTNYDANSKTADEFPIILVKENEWTNEYIEYGTTDEFIINSEQIKSDWYFNDKKILFDGDSLCIGVEDGIGGYPSLFANRFPSATVINYGIAGRTIATNVIGRTENPIVEHIDNWDIDLDYIILEGGINDALEEVTMYTSGLTDIDTNFSTGYPRLATYNRVTNVWSGLDENVYTTVIADTDTFQGALETLLLKTMLKYPTKKYGFILTHRLGRGVDISKQNAYWEVARKICKKYRFPILDLTDVTCLTSEITVLHETYFNQQTTDDWVHPNLLGYKVGYIDKIIEWMKSL